VKVAALLRGIRLGLPVHPLLVTLPIGAWTSAAMLDCVGPRLAAQQLIGVGLAAVPATVLAGLADYPDLTGAQREWMECCWVLQMPGGQGQGVEGSILSARPEARKPV
jgi:uncharacterized membrane protein